MTHETTEIQTRHCRVTDACDPGFGCLCTCDQCEEAIRLAVDERVFGDIGGDDD